MTMTDTTGPRMLDADAPLAVRKGPGPIVRAIFSVPGFLYFLAFYVGVKYFAGDVHIIVFDAGGNYAVSWIELLYTFLFGVALFELTLVSETGVNNTREVGGMLFSMIVFLVLSVAGLGDMGGLGTYFGNVQFLTFTVAAGVQFWVAFVINSRTLMRSVGFTPNHS